MSFISWKQLSLALCLGNSRFQYGYLNHVVKMNSFHQYTRQIRNLQHNQNIHQAYQPKFFLMLVGFVRFLQLTKFNWLKYFGFVPPRIKQFFTIFVDFNSIVSRYSHYELHYWRHPIPFSSGSEFFGTTLWIVDIRWLPFSVISVISSHILPGMWLLIPAGIKVKPW